LLSFFITLQVREAKDTLQKAIFGETLASGGKGGRKIWI